MPDKYNTWIEQGGTNVSGGQRQRLCIARALLKKSKVLILDDSTSAVDTATDAKIKHAFATKIPGTTKLIVSQRISSIQDADRILVLDNGMVSGFDTHEHLVENNKVYREIYEVQTQGGGDFDEQAEEAKENQPVDAKLRQQTIRREEQIMSNNQDKTLNKSDMNKKQSTLPIMKRLLGYVLKNYKFSCIAVLGMYYSISTYNTFSYTFYTEAC